jgi:solute carrier family 66 (lysosomal lysine-arginine transporter), member 1
VRNVNVDADGDEIMGVDGGEELVSEEDAGLTLSEETLKQIELRKGKVHLLDIRRFNSNNSFLEIRQRILSGRVDEAVDLVHTHFPTVLTRSSLDMGTDDDCYLLPNQKRRKVDPDTSPGSNPAAIRFLTSTTVDPLHLNLNLRILAFTEACRTVPLPYHPPSVISSLSGSPSLSDIDSDIDEGEEPALTTSLIPDETTDPIAHQQHLSNLIERVKKLYGLANALPKESDRKTYGEELKQVGGLLAYKVPEESPMARYLSQERREAVADQINAAVLCKSSSSLGGGCNGILTSLDRPDPTFRCVQA